MLKTYKLLKNQRIGAYASFTNEQLAKIYQANQDNAIIAEIYCRNFGSFYRLAHKINFIDNSAKASIILEKIGKCLFNYSDNYSATLLTHIYNNVNNEFGGLKTKRKYKDRDKQDQLLNLDTPDENGLCLYEVIPDDGEELDSFILKLTIDTDTSLSNKEKTLCKLIIDNPGIEVNEIGAAMHITTQYVWLIKKRLAKKLKISLCFND